MLNRVPVIILAVIAVSGIAAMPLVTEQFVDAGTTTKVHFTRTATSVQDPAIGQEDGQMTMILAPNAGTIYDGSLTYTASEPVQLVVLHELAAGDDLGQPVWTVDGNTIYGASVIDQGASAGTLEFTGAGLALRSGDEFVSTVSIDGWIRGTPVEIGAPSVEVKVDESEFRIARAHVPITIPMHEGLHDESSLYYIITDSSDEDYAEMLTDHQGWRVELAPPLKSTPEIALEKVYIFENGVHGDGIKGYQVEVFSSTPWEFSDYSELRQITTVAWRIGETPRMLDSEAEILEAVEKGRIMLTEEETILNMPQIVWPNSQLPVLDVNITSDDFGYDSAQVTDIDTGNMTVTFVAHRGWGPDGATIYYIVTGAAPSGPAEAMGVADVPKYGSLLTSPAAVDLYQFSNGIKGPGALGFQPGISTAALGDDRYSPMWRISLIEWVDPEDAAIVETTGDIVALRAEGLIEITLARPMNMNHVVNCPFVDPFQ